MAEIRRKDCHNAIEREIVSAAPAAPNFRLPEDHPVTVPIWLNPCFDRYPRRFGDRIPRCSDAMIQLVIVGYESNVAEGRLFAQHGAIPPFRPIIEAAARTFIKPGDRAGLNHPPWLEQPRKAHHSQKRQRMIRARCPVKGWVVHVYVASGHGATNVHGHEFRVYLWGSENPSGSFKKILVV